MLCTSYSCCLQRESLWERRTIFSCHVKISSVLHLLLCGLVSLVPSWKCERKRHNNGLQNSHSHLASNTLQNRGYFCLNCLLFGPFVKAKVSDITGTNVSKRSLLSRIKIVQWNIPSKNAYYHFHFKTNQYVAGFEIRFSIKIKWVITYDGSLLLQLWWFLETAGILRKIVLQYPSVTDLDIGKAEAMKHEQVSFWTYFIPNVFLLRGGTWFLAWFLGWLPLKYNLGFFPHITEFSQIIQPEISTENYSVLVKRISVQMCPSPI